jgi:hypothetical protein
MPACRALNLARSRADEWSFDQQPMRPLWTTWHCRHNANLFLLTLAGFFILVVGIAVLYRSGFHEHLVFALPVLGGYLVIWATKAFRRGRMFRGEPPPDGPLSRDELRKARSKLVKNRKAI